MELGLIVLSFIILFNIVFMVYITRMILTTPPHKKPQAHPWVLEYGPQNDSSDDEQPTTTESRPEEASADA